MFGLFKRKRKLVKLPALGKVIFKVETCREKYRIEQRGHNGSSYYVVEKKTPQNLTWRWVMSTPHVVSAVNTIVKKIQAGDL